MAILPAIGTAAAGGIGAALGAKENKGKNFLKGFVRALPAAVGGFLGSKLPGALGGIPGGILGTVIGGALGTKEAQEARKDQSGFFPEFGLSEGLGAIWKAGADARKDQSGFLPELGLTEMGGKILGTDRANNAGNAAAAGALPAAITANSFNPAGSAAMGGAAGLAGSAAMGGLGGSAAMGALPGSEALGKAAYGPGAASDRANNFLGLYDDWTSSTSNSPAAQSGAFTDSERFNQQWKHQQWLKDNNRKYDSRFEGYLR